MRTCFCVLSIPMILILYSEGRKAKHHQRIAALLMGSKDAKQVENKLRVFTKKLWDAMAHARRDKPMHEINLRDHEFIGASRN